MYPAPESVLHNTVNQGVLLLYTGSPESPDPDAVRAYLKRFLMDPYVLDMAHPLRWMLVNAVIAPLRARKSAERYKSVWLPEGSPLPVHTNRFKVALQQVLPECAIGVASAYGTPSMADGIQAMKALGVKQLSLFPLFPHHAAATRGSLIAMFNKEVLRVGNPFERVIVIPPFYDMTGYIDAICEEAQSLLDSFQPEYVIFSYHGLPLRQARPSFPEANNLNYEEQCKRTTTALITALNLDPHCCLHAYQSRFGWKWLAPTLEQTLMQLAASRCRRVVVFAPSFVADCLETLEELDGAAREHFLNAGGVEFLRIPALNNHPAWISAAAAMIRRH